MDKNKYKNTVKALQYLVSVGYLSTNDAKSLIKDCTAVYITQMVEGRIARSFERSITKSLRSLKRWATR